MVNKSPTYTPLPLHSSHETILTPARSRSSLIGLVLLCFGAAALWHVLWSTAEAHGLYDDAVDAHGVVGRVHSAAGVLTIITGRLSVGAFIGIFLITMRRMQMQFEGIALLSVLAVAYLYCWRSHSQQAESADSYGLYENAPDTHGGALTHTNASRTSVLIIVASRLAMGLLVILAGALARRFLSRLGLVQSRSSGPEGIPSLPLPLNVERRRVQIPGAVAWIKNNSFLFFCFAVWYYGNYQHNICNKLALRDTDGADGFPFTIALCQLGVGVLYAVFLWIAPDARERPTITMQDWYATLPVSFAAAGAHAGSVFAVSAGALSFGQIVKSCEPAFAAVVGTLFYGCMVSKARWMCLIPIIGGVALSAVVELDFSCAALIAGTMANVFAAVRSNENKRLMAADGIKDRLGSVGNQYAITTINAFLFLAPLALYREGHKLHLFIEACRFQQDFLYNVVMSGWWFYIYNEVATIIIQKTGAVTQSIANTAKRAVIILLAAVVLGESLSLLKLVGCAIAIGGVFLYSEIDKYTSPQAQKPEKVSDKRMSSDATMFVKPQSAHKKPQRRCIGRPVDSLESLASVSTMAEGSISSPSVSDSDETSGVRQSPESINRVPEVDVA